MAKRPVPRYDFKAFGAAIKAAREGCKESRKKVGDEMFISPRYLANIENKGQHPSLQIFFELIQRYHISVDQFLLETPPEKNTQRRQLDALLDGMSDTGISLSRCSPNLRGVTAFATTAPLPLGKAPCCVGGGCSLRCSPCSVPL